MRRPTQVWKLRLAAIVVGCLPVVLAEFVLRILDVPSQRQASDPYIDVSQLAPLFVPSADKEDVEIGTQRLDLFNPQRFSRNKPHGTFRIFALGGSTTFGEPYSAPTAFPKWLELNLQAAIPNTKFEVINCGGLSYASYRVLAILREVLEYDADLIVVYTGHNEYLERRTYPQLSKSNTGSISGFSRLRLLQLAQLAWRSDRADRSSAKPQTTMKAEVDALLDYAGGLEDYHRNDPWRGPVVEHFRWNLDQMSRECEAAGVPLVVIKPVSNLLDCPPIKFEASPALDQKALERFELAWETSRAASQSQQAMAALQEALQIDPEHAGCNYLMGQLLMDDREYGQAKLFLERARDFDVCPLRATTPLAAAVSENASSHGSILVDAASLFADRSPHGIVGRRWLVDHIHPSVEGNQLLGEAIATQLLRSGLLKATQQNWLAERDVLAEKHLSSLTEAYYHRGQQRLEGLLLWTQGRAKKVRSDAQN